MKGLLNAPVKYSLPGKLISLFVFSACSINLSAAQFVSWHGYEIHYAAFSSLLIPEKVAKAHNIIRSKRRIVTNISVQQAGHSVTAIVSGHSTNLLDQNRQMIFDEVDEQEAVYYLANQVIDEKDRVKFSISIRPVGEAQSYTLEFTREYY